MDGEQPAKRARTAAPAAPAASAAAAAAAASGFVPGMMPFGLDPSMMSMAQFAPFALAGMTGPLAHFGATMSAPTVPVMGSSMSAATLAAAPKLAATPAAAAAAAGALSVRPAMAVAAVPAMQRERRPPETRSPTEIKETLLRLGCSITNLSPRQMVLVLQETEAQVRRAEKTKTLERHQDQRLLSCFTEGLAPGPEALLRMLEAGSDPNTISTGGGSGFAPNMTPLLAASSWGKVDEVRLLLAAGVDTTVTTPNMRQTCMHLVAGGNIERWGAEKTMGLLRLLVDKAPELLTVKNAMNKTPLDCAKYEKKRQQAAYLQNLPH
ncbi:unnamed protein product [Effrenium voratum]|nr:unnamed protein product [Effrenium voratum]